jgi:hypothetical protein
MPSSEIMPLYRAGKLHSGSSSGKIVKNPKQAKAILLSYLRKENKIPEESEGPMVKAFRKARK